MLDHSSLVELDLRFFTADDGARIAYWVAGPEDAPTLMLIHGWAVSKEYWRPLLPKDHPPRYRLIIPDIRGHGDSEQKPPYTTIQAAKDFLALSNHEHVDFVVGHSWGGVIAQRVAALGSFKGAVFASTFAKLSSFPTHLVEWALPFLERMDMETFARLSVRFGYHIAHENVDWLYDVYRSAKRDVVIQSGKDILRYDGRHLLPRIKCPVLVVHGEKDMVVPPAHGKYLWKRIRDADMVIFPDSGHDVVLEAGRTFRRVLYGFIDDVLKYDEAF
ncbi:MAG: alpha/beta hydrolase [Candidatus Diapherotrites archaeon]|nr:alpha/beta hydrolase [Candidatus Diapherotrites archaeon]